MVSLYPAQVLIMDHYFGKVEVGFNSDLVFISEDLKTIQFLTVS